MRGSHVLTGAATLLIATLPGVHPPALAGDADATVTLVAAPGDAPSNVALGEFIVPAPEHDRISIADDGSAMFTAEVRDAAGALVSSEALVVGRAGDLEVLVGVGGEVPGTSVPELDEFEVLRIQSARRTTAGDTVVECTTGDGLFQLRTLLTYVGNAGDVGAVEFFRFAETCPLSRIGDGVFARPYALNGGTLTFYGSTRVDECGDDLLHMYRRPAAAAAGVIVLEGGPVPGVPGETFEPLFAGPVANSDGDALFMGRFRSDGGDVVDMLILAPIDGGPEMVASETSIVPGTAEEIVGLGPWTIGGDLTASGMPRVAFVASAEAAPGQFAIGTTYHVFDSVSGAAPVITTGDSDGTHTFAAVPGSGTPQISIDGTNGIVLVADVSGPGISGDPVPGVWRRDPDVTPQLALVLYEGGPVPGADGETRTVARIFTAHANAFGLVAAEVELSDGKQAILLERAGAVPGTFAVAVEQGDQVPIGDGTAALVGIVNQPKNDPVLTRSGTDGLQSRFSDGGLFVFRGAANFGGGGAKSGVWIVTIQDPGTECDVTARVERGSLVVRGDKGGCAITIVSSTDGIVRIDPGDGTTINGERSSWSGDFTKGVDIRMGGGDDRVVLRSTQVAGDESSRPDVFRDLFIDMGFGSDSLRLEDVQIEGSLAVKPGDGLQENVDVIRCFVARNFQLQAAKGKSITNLVGLAVEGKSKIANGNAPGVENLLTLTSCFMDGAVLKGGSSADRILVDRSEFQRPLTIDSGTSAVDFVTVRDVVIEKGDLSVRARRSDFLHLNISNTTASNGNVAVQTGPRGCDVNVSNVTAAKALSIKTGGTREPSDSNEIDLLAIRCDRVKVRGTGSHEFAIASGSRIARGVKLKTKKGVVDQLNVSGSTIESGNLSVISGAAAAEVRLSTLTLEDGAVSVKATNGADQIFVTDSTIAGGLKVAGRGGDDTITLEMATVEGDRVLDGGKDDDALVLDEASTVGGKDTRKNIER